MSPLSVRRFRITGWTAIATLAVAITLMVTSIFVFVLPAVERELVNQERVKIKALTDTVWSTISYFHEQELSGLLSREEAQRRAKEFVRHVRYGSQERDYFWITDKSPRFIMHPTLPEIEGVDLSGYPTITGRTIGEFARIVEDRGAGYLEYMWPAPGDSTRMLPKIAYAQEFAPWGWVIGTGVLMDEVESGVASARKRVLGAALAILLLMSGVQLINIRQQRRAEQQRDAARDGLAETERKYRDLFEDATEGIFQSTPDGNLLTANPAFARIFGYVSPEDAVARVNDIAHQCYADPLVREEFKKRIERDDVVQYFEFDGKRVDGSHVQLMMNAHVVRDRKGAVRFYEGIIQDVTHLKQTQAELQRLNEELEKRVMERASELARAAEELQSVSSVILRWDPEGNVLYMNEYGLKLFKFERDELIGQNVIDTIVPPRDRSGVDLHEMIANLLQDPARYAQNENENVCKDGSRLWMAWTNKPIYDSSGDLKEILTIGIDISGRKRVEEELREARGALERALEEQQAFIESISDVFYVIDDEWKLIRWNRQMERLTGCSGEELAGKSLTDFIVKEDVETVRDRLERLRHDDGVRIEARVASRSGERIPHEFHTRRVGGDTHSRRNYVGIAHDLTDRLTAQARLVEAEKMRALSGMVAGFLHELNTPLGALLGSLSVVSHGVERLSRLRETKGDQAESSGKIEGLIRDGESTARDAADRITTILRGLKTFVNLDRAFSRPHDIHAAIDSILKLLNPAARGIEIVQDYGHVGFVRCYPDEINQMLTHVIGNALGAMSSGGKLTVRTKVHDGAMRIEIGDTGRGITEERLANIFEPQFTEKTTRMGAGLGLFTCYHIANKHGGRIGIESRVGVGTTVSIELPCEQKLISNS
jgi:PAS domain S-box-containing protein